MTSFVVTPAQAGGPLPTRQKSGIPAFAGMTKLWAIPLAMLVIGCQQGKAVGNSMLDVGLMRVQDQANIIPASDEIDLARKSEALEKATTDQLVIVTVPTLDGESINDYSLALARSLRIGRADNDNGVLLLVAPKERAVRIEVGYGLENLLRDEVAGKIVRDMVPLFRANQPAQAIGLGEREIIDVLKSDARRPQYLQKKAA